MYVFISGAYFRRGEGAVFLYGCYICCTTVSAFTDKLPAQSFLVSSLVRTHYIRSKTVYVNGNGKKIFVFQSRRHIRSIVNSHEYTHTHAASKQGQLYPAGYTAAGTRQHGDSWLLVSSRLVAAKKYLPGRCLAKAALEKRASSLTVPVPVAAETYLPCRCLAMTASTRSTIFAFSRHVTLITGCDALMVSTAYNIHSSRDGSRAAVPQLLPPAPCSSRAPWSICESASLILRPAVSSHRHGHLSRGLDRRPRFSLMGGPKTRPNEAIYRLQGSFQLHRRSDYITRTSSLRCRHPKRRNGNSSLPSCSTRRLKS
jgi:hypothetical protein